MDDLASRCIEQIEVLGFKNGTKLNIFCPGYNGSIQVISDKPDKVEIQKYLDNHRGHDCFFGFNDGRRWKIQNDGGIESDRPLSKSNPEPNKREDTISDSDIFEGDPFEDGTWIKLYRKFIKNPIFKDSASVHLWLYLLLKANHKSNRFVFNKKEILVKRGQLVTGLHKISKDTGISEWRVRERLKAFEALDMTTSKTTNKFRIITVCNYTEYQDSISKKPQAKPQAVDSMKLHPNPQSTHNQTTTNKNVKNDKNKKPFIEGSIELQLASFLLEEILKNKPDFKRPNLQTWAREIDLLLRRDGRTPDRVREVIVWVQGDSFWRSNILSTASLRKQFDRLELSMQKISIQGPDRTTQYQDLTGRGSA